MLNKYEVSRLDLVISLAQPRKYKRRLKFGVGTIGEVDFGNIASAELSKPEKTFRTYVAGCMFPELRREMNLGAITLVVVPKVTWMDGSEPRVG